MVVGFDLEDSHKPVADIDDACIFTRTLHHMLPARRQPSQMDSRRFIRTMLAPADAENSKLSNIGIASQNLLDARVFLRRQPMLSRNLRRHFNFSLDCCHVSECPVWPAASECDGQENVLIANSQNEIEAQPEAGKQNASHSNRS